MARNLINQVVTHLAEYNGMNIGDVIGRDFDGVPAVDHAGVCTVTDGVIESFTEFAGHIRMQVVNEFVTGKVVVSRCRSYYVGGPHFDSLYPPNIDELPVLVSHQELMAAIVRK